jgi:hypothetical protein
MLPFFMALFGQVSFKLLFLGEDRIQLTHFLQLIFKELSLSHPLHYHLQELILGPRMLEQRLHMEKVKTMP